MAIFQKNVFFFILVLTVSIVPNFVSCECPNPGTSSVVEYKGTYINISDVVACAHVNRGKSMVIISSFDTTYVDVDYPNHNETLTNMIQPSLLIITPYLFTEAPRKLFNLSGVSGAALPKPSGQGRTEGKPGNPGGTAGSFLLAYDNSNVGDEELPIIEMNGGFAGVGQDGQDGRDGKIGMSMIINESDCTASEDGWTKFGIVPNYCHEFRDNEGRCIAGETGARWEFPGEEGERGEDANRGGQGGLGGIGGVFLRAYVTQYYNYPLKVGQSRYTGPAGKRGNPGKGGKTGDTGLLRVGVENSSGGKKCTILEGPILQPVEEFAKDGGYGLAGQNARGRMKPKPRFQLKEFRPYIKSYINDCVFEATRRDDAELLWFCRNVKFHFQL